MRPLQRCMAAGGNRGQIIAGAIAWIAKLEFFVAEYIAAAAWTGYSLRDDTISRLGTHSCERLVPGPDAVGAMCSPLSWIMNGGLILAGLLTITGAVLTRAAWPATRAVSVALGLIVVAGMGTIGVGVWPVDGNEFLHATSTLITFIPGSIGVIVLGKAIMPRHRMFGITTVLFGAVSLSALALFGGHIYLGLGHGGMERVAGYGSTLCYVVAGIFLLAARRA